VRELALAVMRTRGCWMRWAHRWVQCSRFSGTRSSEISREIYLHSIHRRTSPRQDRSCVLAGAPRVFRHGHSQTAPWPTHRPSEVKLIAEFDVIFPEVADILAAIDLHRLHGVSFWDALVLRAAKQAGRSILLSEDMQGNREIDGVQIVNPFQ